MAGPARMAWSEWHGKRTAESGEVLSLADARRAHQIIEGAVHGSGKIVLIP
ncbi:hypothetical protein LMG29542_06091 [Paraburkholderia humisilvae]|uniref:Uncharacterized protein n=1 Tax=Paraburkholderia humisilvae TaxID=627669 RepID=A0A6J5ES76_9BURK|nr:hypothetical protein LMG29542_06091 [Paraburkholderia humisilvae]